MASVIYTIVEKNYEYDDNYYFSTGAFSKNVYSFIEEGPAIKKLEELNIKELYKAIKSGYYVEDMFRGNITEKVFEEIPNLNQDMSSYEFFDFINDYFKDKKYNDDYDALTKEQKEFVKELYNCCGVSFYEICASELVDEFA